MHVGAASFAYKAQVGNAYTVGARDEDRPPTGLAGRLARTQRNFLETFPIFAAVMLTVHVAGAADGWRVWGGVMYLVGRVVYLPLYALGVPWAKTFAWNLATLGIVVAGVAVFA